MTSLAKGRLILYGRGLIAEEYCRYLEGCGRGGEIAAFAVTELGEQENVYCGYPCLDIAAALKAFPQAEIHLALQEKYHAEVIALLKEMGRMPKEIIGLRRMTALWGEQAMKQIAASCSELTVKCSEHDYSTLEIINKAQPTEKFTFYPMCQVPLSEQDLANIRAYVQRENLYIAMAASGKDAKVSQESLPEYIHPVLGGAAAYEGERSQEMEYDDEERDNISRYNDLYSELTVAYHLWKKAPRARYLGLCHYRRHFVLTYEVKVALAEDKIDVLLPRPRITVPDVRTFFTELPVTYTDKLDYETMLKYIGKRDGKMASFAEEFFSGQIQFPNNMVIARREIYLRYCSFLFGVLQDMQAYYQDRDIVRQKRYLGNVGEMLTALYFAYHKDKWRTDFTDYKLLE